MSTQRTMDMVYPTAGGGGGGVSQCLSIYREGDSQCLSNYREGDSVCPSTRRDIVSIQLQGGR